jgi:hypothetical protein
MTDDPMIISLMETMGVVPVRVSEGVYENCDHNLHLAIQRGTYDSIRSMSLPAYGVVDSIAQFMELFGEDLRQSDDVFCVGFTQVRRDEQPEVGGWRWHKWGQYFGKHEITCEYLYDEKDVDVVYTFEVERLRAWKGL